MKWRVVKNEWGHWCSDYPPFDSFEEACEVALSSRHMNVVDEYLFEKIEALPPTRSRLLEQPETD